MDEEKDIRNDVPPEPLERDIAQTRQDMTSTINEIRDRLTPAHLKEHAKESVQQTANDKISKMKGAASRMSQSISSRAQALGETAKTAGSTVMTTIRSNPVPLVMIGASVAWLVLNKTRGDMVSEQGSALKQQAGELASRAQEKAGELSGQMKETGSAWASKAGQSAQQLSRTAQERARAASSGFWRMIDQNPVGMFLAAFGVGAALGLSIPESRKEQEMMGSASETLLSRAKETAERTLQKAQHAAEQAVRTAEEEFKKSAA